MQTSQLNKHLSNYMEGLTAKVFRTYNASYTMSNLLQQLDPKKYKNATINEKVKLYNDCNREVAILCNHKRSVGAKHEETMEKMADRVRLSIFLSMSFAVMLSSTCRSRVRGTSCGAPRR